MGKEYYANGNLEFEGEYLNGKINGKEYYYLNFEKLIKYIKKWGLGIGDWGLGIGDWAHSPIPNPQSPIPNPQSPLICFI